MRTMKKIILCLVFQLFVQAFLGAASITLYFEPDTEAAIAAEINPNDPALDRAEPVLEAVKRKQGWLWMEHVVNFNGFVKNEEIGKNLSVKTGVFVRLRPDDASPILTIIEKDDVTDLIRVGDWSEIGLTKAVPVYLQEPASVSLAAPVVHTSAADARPAVSGPIATPGYVGTVASRDIQPPHFEGTLKPYRNFFRLPSKYSLKLVDERGKFIAFVDDESLLISGALNDYLGRQVVIYGVMNPLKDIKYYEIKATAIRLKLFAVPD